MKTKNLFRMLLMAVFMVMGWNDLKADTFTLWESPNGESGTLMNSWTSIKLDKEKLAKISADDVLKFYGSVDSETDSRTLAIFGSYNNLIIGIAYAWQATPFSNGVASYTFTADHVNTIRSDAGGPCLTCNGINLIKVEVEHEGKANLPLSFLVSEASVNMGETFQSPVLSNISVTVTYSSEDTNVVTVDPTTGLVTPVNVGSTNVIASFEGDDTYNATTASYKITVNKGTPVLSFPEETYSIALGQLFTPPTLYNPQNVSVYYFSYNTYPADVDRTTGVITTKNTGEIEVIAKFDGNDNWNAAEAKYKLTITEAAAAPTHTLTINIDGQAETKTVAEGTTLTTVLPTPSKEGYTFTGWSGLPDNGLMGAEDLTVTAQFSINSYKLTYKVDGEVFGDVETIEYGASITPRTAPTKEGFSFSGWNGLPETMPAHDVEVTGEFTGIKYKVEIASTTYGVITTDKEAYEKGETVTVTIKDNTGYEMESISTDPTNLGLQRVDDGVFSFVMPDADVMVTVRFKAKEYTLTFMLNNEVYEVGEIPQVYQVRYGTNITLPADPAQEEGYTFSGWSGIPADGNMPAGDLTVYGHFNAILSVGSTGYATYCPTKPVIFQGNEDIKAYIAKEKSDSEVTLIQVIGAVAAGTGLVLVGDADAEMEFEVTNEGTDYSNENLMIGVTGASANIHASNLYVLVQKEDGVKFADTAANAATVPVGKAYLQAPVNSSRILTICFGDESTGMETVHASTNKKVEVYNLSGQRIANPKKGLYIVNGKKAFFK